MDSPLSIPAGGTPAIPGLRARHRPAVTGTDPEQLMLAYAAGDAAAFDRLYEQFRAPLYRFILRQVRDPASSNDVYQQCWEKVIKGRHSYRSKSPFAAWLFHLARNTVIDHFRRQSRHAADAAFDIEVLPYPGGDLAGPEDQAVASEEDGRLAAAVDALPPEQREVVLLRLEAGLDLAAIAEVTRCKPETCKSRLRYALAKLQHSMNEDGMVAGQPSGGEHATF
jgi:RNA polymerase sigma-70 factor (ECF subfamily)